MQSQERNNLYLIILTILYTIKKTPIKPINLRLVPDLVKEPIEEPEFNGSKSSSYTYGQYDPAENKIIINKNSPPKDFQDRIENETTYLHELNHAYQNNMWGRGRENDQYALVDKPIEDIYNDEHGLLNAMFPEDSEQYKDRTGDFHRYALRPKEIHSRLMQLRYLNKDILKPDTFVTPELYEKLKVPKSLNLLRYFEDSPEKIINLLNGTVDNSSKDTPVTKAKNGVRITWQTVPKAEDGIAVDNTAVKKPLLRLDKQDPRSIQPNDGTIDVAKPQSSLSKGWEIISHPVTALTNLSKQGRIPDNFSKGDTNLFENVVDILNPAFYANAVARTAKNVVDPKTYTDIPKAIAAGVINMGGEQASKNLNEAGARTVGRVGDALASLPVAVGSAVAGIKGFTKVAKQSPLVREMVYKGIDPLGYGAREKIVNFVPNLVKYSINPEAKLANATKEFKGIGLLDSDAEQFAKNRMDAWRVGLNLDQKYNTFAKIGENKYTFNPGVMEPSKYTLSDVHGDALANIITKGRSNNRYYKPTIGERAQLKDLTRSKDIRIGEAPVDMTRNYDTYQQNMLVDNFNKDFTTSVYDSDRYTGVMGAFRWDINHTNDGLHFQANDTWDLHPFATRGNYTTRGYATQAASKHLYESLKNVEMLDVLGGKPFDIQTNFLVDPKNYKVLKQFKTGGKVPSWKIID